MLGGATIAASPGPANSRGGKLVSPRTPLVRFGVFEFHPGSGDLWKAGRRIRLQNQPRQVLKALITRRGELVSRDQLRRELWPDETFVDFDNGLNVAIRKLRDAFGDDAASPRFIETERAQGYRFIAPVSDSTVQDAGPTVTPAPADVHRPRSSRRLVLVSAAAIISVVVASLVWLWRDGRRHEAATTLASSPVPISLAVLPLRSASAGDEDLLGIGISDAIVTRLSGLRQVRVRTTSRVEGIRDAGSDTADLGRRLDVQYLLVGTIRATTERVRVSVQLVSTGDGTAVWGDRYDVLKGDVLTIEDAVAERIATALRVHVSDAERERLYRRFTRHGAAYEHYLMGRARLRSVTEQDALRAIAEFEAARRLDPDYAPAHAGIATAAAQLRVRFAPGKEAASWEARARQEAGRALQLEPDLAEAHVALAAVHRFQGYDWDTVIRESRRAVELNPSLDLPHLYLAVALFHLGLLDDAESAVNAARQLNPESRMEPLEILGAVHLFGGRTADAVADLSQLQHLSDSLIARYLLGWTLYYEGQTPRAEAMLETMIRDTGPLPANARATLAAIRAAGGATSEARALAERVASEPDLLHHAAYGLGTAYAQLREPASAVRWLSQAAATGFPCYPWYERDPLLDPIRNDPGFGRFMRELRRSWQDARARYRSAPLD